MNTVVAGSAICSTVIWNWNSGGDSGSRWALSAATSRRTSSCSGVSTAMVTVIYSTTLGTMKKLSSLSGALVTIFSA